MTSQCPDVMMSERPEVSTTCPCAGLGVRQGLKAWFESKKSRFESGVGLKGV